jgi:hypothetical protein
LLESAVSTAGEDAVWHFAAIERARAACLAALGRDEEARACLDEALRAATSRGVLYEELLIRRDRAGLAAAGVDVDGELREAERLAQLLGIVQR